MIPIARFFHAGRIRPKVTFVSREQGPENDHFYYMTNGKDELNATLPKQARWKMVLSCALEPLLPAVFWKKIVFFFVTNKTFIEQAFQSIKMA